jgi:RNA polymerase sigma-70 factor (ECF subfamily)
VDGPVALPAVHAAVERVYREESRRVLATLIRLLGDFDRAEEALHDAVAAALVRWPAEGVPANPRAWLVSAGRFRAVDRLRRERAFEGRRDAVAEALADAAGAAGGPADDGDVFGDDRLRLIFTCCHPALAVDAQVALTLRTVAGLTTEEIARAFLVPAPTLAQRVVRAKAKIRAARIPYEVPGASELPARLDAALAVVYLVFNEGYAATAGDAVTRADLSAEAIRLGRLLAALLPGEAECAGLLALMLLHDSRRRARATAAGDVVLLEAQDRALWDRAQIAEGLGLARRALAGRPVGAYALQAGIAAVHAEAADAASTDWRQIVGLYDALLAVRPSPVAALNRAAAVAMADGPGCGLVAGLALVDGLLADGALAGYALAHAARADLLRRLGRAGEARSAYAAALALTGPGPQRRFLARRLAELGRRGPPEPEGAGPRGG